MKQSLTFLFILNKNIEDIREPLEWEAYEIVRWVMKIPSLRRFKKNKLKSVPVLKFDPLADQL